MLQSAMNPVPGVHPGFRHVVFMAKYTLMSINFQKVVSASEDFLYNCEVLASEGAGKQRATYELLDSKLYSKTLIKVCEVNTVKICLQNYTKKEAGKERKGREEKERDRE